MADAKSLDYAKLKPLLPTFLSMVASLEKEEERVLMLDALVRDAMRRTTSEIVGAQRQLQEKSLTPAATSPLLPTHGDDDSQAADEDVSANGIDAAMVQSLLPDAAEPSLQKISVFLNKYKGLKSLITSLFIESDGKIERIYTSLKTSKKSEAQRRVILLQCLANAITAGKFTATIEAVKQECKDFGVYDVDTFATNHKKNSALFKSGGAGTSVELNEAGEAKLAETVKAMSSEG